MITSIRNGQLARKVTVVCKYKTIFPKILDVIWDEGFICGYKIITENNEKKLRIFLKYQNGNPVITSINFISKPGHRIYYSSKQIWKIDSNKICIVFSTTKGIKSLIECKKLNIGGEAIFSIN